jgi:integrase
MAAALKVQFSAALIERLKQPGAFSMMPARLNKRGGIEWMQTPDGIKEWSIRDAAGQGLLIRMTPGSASWYVQRKVGTRRMLRAFGSLRRTGSGELYTLPRARSEAAKLFGQLAEGRDPKKERREEIQRKEAAHKLSRATLLTAFEEMEKDLAGKGETTTAKDRAAVKKWMTKSPLFRVPFLEITRDDVARSFEPIRQAACGEVPWVKPWPGAPEGTDKDGKKKTKQQKKERGESKLSGGTFLKIHAYCAAAWKHKAIALKLPNAQFGPFVEYRSIRKYPASKRRKTWLDTGKQTGTAWIRNLVEYRDRMYAEDNPSPHLAVLADYALLVLLWGSRLRETLRLNWSQVDFEQRLVFLDPSTTKSGVLGVLPLTPWAEEILRDRHAHDQHWRPDDQVPFVFRSRRRGKQLYDPRRVFEELTEATGTKITSHDLRRTVATETAGDADAAVFSSLVIAAAILKHAQSRGAAGGAVTEGYLMQQAETMRPVFERREDRLREIAGLAPLSAKPKGQGAVDVDALLRDPVVRRAIAEKFVQGV